MNKEEKVALLDKLAADKDLTAYIIGCARGDLTSKDLTACIWYILHPTDDTLAWSGSRWVPLGGDVQVCNFLSKEAARTYADEVFHR